jgi:hypothetical protein
MDDNGTRNPLFKKAVMEKDGLFFVIGDEEYWISKEGESWEKVLMLLNLFSQDLQPLGQIGTSWD